MTKSQNAMFLFFDTIVIYYVLEAFTIWVNWYPVNVHELQKCACSNYNIIFFIKVKSTFPPHVSWTDYGSAIEDQMNEHELCLNYSRFSFVVAFLPCEYINN